MPAPFPLPSPPIKSGFNIDRFRASFVEEPTRQSHYDVLIIPPYQIIGDLIQKGILATPMLAFRCDAAEIPGKVSQSFDFRDYGPVSQIVNGAVYPDISLEFICTHGMPERQVWDVWQDYITNSDSTNFLSGIPKVAQNVVDGLIGGSSAGSNDVEYYDNYVAERFVIRLYDVKGFLRNEYYLTEAFPRSVSAQPLGWANGEEVVKVRVDIAYRTMDSVSYFPQLTEFAIEHADDAKKIAIAAAAARLFKPL